MRELHVDSVMKSYDDRRILTDIFLSCAPGEIIGLLGRNGCGKSTLLKIIFGTEKAESRFVRIGDKVVTNVHDCYNLIKYLPQDSFLPASMRVRKVIKLFCSTENGQHIAEHPLLAQLLDKRCRALSVGESRLFEILLVIFSDAEFILIDEPFNGISPLIVEEIKTLIKKQAATKGFIITDHNYRNILDISTKIRLIHDGAIKTIHCEEELRDWGYLP